MAAQSSGRYSRTVLGARSNSTSNRRRKSSPRNTATPKSCSPATIICRFVRAELAHAEFVDERPGDDALAADAVHPRTVDVPAGQAMRSAADRRTSVCIAPVSSRTATGLPLIAPSVIRCPCSMRTGPSASARTCSQTIQPQPRPMRTRARRLRWRQERRDGSPGSLSGAAPDVGQVPLTLRY